ncbi:MAG: peptide ABC transporter substrate-binding protein [Nitrospiraceae bacterium]|nr:peptide ABC transporter substrate-binding protein [Nitrospiraceae bacterium]|tara:strand:+ start:4662 stop:6794 length:2133 start_codon:yes stop_codon:yes gene_type:complete
MWIKRLLILVPLLLAALLLQSYFWVPTYETQTKGNPKRLLKYIEASSGDAKILNPILNADSASSTIVGMVFEGLVDLDENLALRGRLATNWAITEQAYLLVDPDSQLPDGKPATSARIEQRIQYALDTKAFPELNSILLGMRRIPSELQTTTIDVRTRDGKNKPKTTSVAISITIPERLAFTLNRVDQDFFDRLTPVIGNQYGTHFRHNKYLNNVDSVDDNIVAQVKAQLPSLLNVTEHNPEILFHLRQGVRFHDGQEFDATDVKFTYASIMNPRNISPRTSDFEPIKAIEILDSHTIKIIYKRLYSPAISAWTMGILPEHLLNDTAMQKEMDERNLSEVTRETFGMRDSTFNRNPIGVGPFRFVEWQGDQFIKLDRNEDYWEGAPEYEQYIVRIIPDSLIQEVEFRTGAIDFYSTLPHQVARYREDDRYQNFSNLGFGYVYIGYNNRKPLFANPQVRRAMSMAINVDEIIEYIMYNEAERVTGPFPKITEWYDESIQPVPYDPEGARTLLASLGWEKNTEGWLEKDGNIFEFNMVTNSGNSIRKNIMSIAQNAWKKIGIKCNTQYFEWAVFLKDFINTGDFDATVLGWSMGIDPDLYQIWHSSQAGPQQLNFVGYNNPQVDKLIVRIRQEYDRVQQRTLTHKLHKIIHEDQPYTFLYASKGTRILDKKIVIVEPQPDGTERYKKIYPLKHGAIQFYFNKWRKLEHTPAF